MRKKKCLLLSIMAISAMGIFSASKKDKGGDAIPKDSGLYIRFKVNGVAKEYKTAIPNNRVTYFYLGQFETYHATIFGIARQGDAQQLPVKNMINISVRSKESIKANVKYDLQTAVPAAGAKFTSIEFTYADETGELFNAVLLAENYPLLDIRDAATVTFSETGGDFSKGTFDGKIFHTQNRAAALTITDGEFYLPVYRQ